MRIQKFLRSQGFGSLKECDRLTAAGKVFVNGRKLCAPTCYLEPGDTVVCLGKTAVYKGTAGKAAEHISLKFNKPKGVVSSKTDFLNRPVVFDFLKKVPRGENRSPLIYAGRLDVDSRGLMIFSTDGSFINRLTHPSFGVDKEYIVRTQPEIDPDRLAQLAQGFSFEGETYTGFRCQFLDSSRIRFFLTEGKKREIRQIVKCAGSRVIDLIRVRIGEYKLGTLREGEWSLLK